MDEGQGNQEQQTQPPAQPQAKKGKGGLITIVILILIGIGAVYALSKQADAPTIAENDTATPTEGFVEDVATYTLADIAEHADAADCWMAIEGEVYDVTAFIESDKHGGGNAILLGCGKDGTELFNERPNTGTEHSDFARGLLPEYFIGNLIE